MNQNFDTSPFFVFTTFVATSLTGTADIFRGWWNLKLKVCFLKKNENGYRRLLP